MDDEAQERRRRRRWRAGASLALVGGLAGAALATAQRSEDPEPTFCTTEGMIASNGQTFGRSGRFGCQFVDANGELLVTTPDGDPICYDESLYVSPCNEAGARPASADGF